MEIINDIYRSLVDKYKSLWRKIYLHLEESFFP